MGQNGFLMAFAFMMQAKYACHGHLSTLVAAMRVAWPHIKSSSDIVPWGIHEHCTHSVACEILDYIERTSSPSAEDPELIQRLEYYMEIESASLAAYLNHLNGRSASSITSADASILRRLSSKLSPPGFDSSNLQD